jgi:CubicO group peptidase (beta-lactamase class C family)
MVRALLLAATALALPAASLHAAGPARAAVQDAGVQDVGMHDLAGIDHFIDGVLAQQIMTREVAGAVVTIVKDGQTILNRGYGFADIENEVPVDPSRHLFRPGSVSKLLTWTALMQQVEAGRVDLDADVNTYLDFVIPALDGEPIRVRHLFTHTPGMSDAPGIITRDPDKLLAFRDWMKANLPRRVWPAGTEISYSNYGAALAGYIIEQVTGTDFDTYVEANLFAPLGMAATSFREPLPEPLAGNLVKGYRYEDGRFVAQPAELISAIAPAGSVSSTGPDMARFMLAMLNQGSLDGQRILQPGSVQFLLADAHGTAPGLPGMANGFFVYRSTGPRLVGHGGNTADFHAMMALSPEHGFGVFIVMTGGAGSYAARTELTDALIGKLFPEPAMLRLARPEQEPVPSGAFRINRRDYSADPRPEYDIQITSAGPDAITVTALGKPAHWERVGPLLYEKTTGAGPSGPFDRLRFVKRPGGWSAVFATQPHVVWHCVPDDASETCQTGEN